VESFERLRAWFGTDIRCSRTSLASGRWSS
jgi:hypothetical protein